MYQFKYILNDNDYYEFNKYHILNSKANKKIFLFLKLLVPIMFLILILLSLTNNDKSIILYETIIYGIIAIVWILCFKPFILFILKIHLKLLKKDGKLPYGKDVLIQFDENIIIETTNTAETKTDYTVIEKIAVNNNAIYIYKSSVEAFIIPFSVFETEEQKNEFLVFINNKVVKVNK